MQESADQSTVHGSQKPTSAIIIANPSAGSYKHNQQQIQDTLVYLRERGWQVELKLTKQAGDGRYLAKEAVRQQCDVLIAVGGDGTINEVIQELAGSETALGVLPSGTVNVWAREIGIPLTNHGAREVLVSGQIRRIDLGQVNQRYFLLMCSLGFDAEVAHTIEQQRSKRFGILKYIVLGTWLGLGYSSFTAFLQVGQRTIRMRSLQVIFGNTQLYAGAIRITWRARCDDGLLDFCVVRNQNIFGRISVLIDFLLRRKGRQQWVRYEAAKEIKLHTSRPVAIQVDGDPEGHTSKRGFPATVIRVAPGALKVLVPQELPEGLFTQPALPVEH